MLVGSSECLTLGVEEGAGRWLYISLGTNLNYVIFLLLEFTEALIFNLPSCVAYGNHWAKSNCLFLHVGECTMALASIPIYTAKGTLDVYPLRVWVSLFKMVAMLKKCLRMNEMDQV